MTDSVLLCFALQSLVGSGQLSLPQENIDLACSLSEQVILESEERDLEPEILLALIYVESRWNPKAISSVGACGLTQVMSKYVPQSCSDLLNPKTSLRVGAKALRFWLDHADDSYYKGLACYNAGYICDKSSEAEKYSMRIIKIANSLKTKMFQIKSEEDSF